MNIIKPFLVLLILSFITINLHAKPNTILVRGFITVNVPTENKKVKPIHLPNIKVYLQSLSKPVRPATNNFTLGNNVINKPENLIPKDFKIKPSILLSNNNLNLSDLLTTKFKKVKATTDLSGRFTLRTKNISRYRVCWEAPGYISGCTKKIIPAKADNIYLGNLNIKVDTKKITLGDRTIALTSPVYGDVRLQDKTIPRAFDPLANINVFPKVDLEDTNKKVLYSAFVNNSGVYFLPQVPLQGKVLIKAHIESEETVIPLHEGGQIKSSKFRPIHITLHNKKPRLNALVPVNAVNQRVKVAQSGETIFLKANGIDPDGDALKYKWVISDGAGNLSNLNAQDAVWTLPNSPGRYSIKVYAYDTKGGYASTKLALKVLAKEKAGKPHIVFSGYVSGTDTPKIKKAEVEINGQKTLTNSQGFFRIHVNNADRFVLNIRKRGYSLVSDIYDDSVIGGSWRLTRATVKTVDPTKQITVSNERKRTDCPSSASASVNWSKYPKLVTSPEWQDGKGNFAHRPKLERKTNRELKLAKAALFGSHNPKLQDEGISKRGCGLGISVRIPPNSLVDSNGNPPPGMVNVQLSTVNLASPEQMPGDYSAETLSGDIQVMRSYGAGEIKIYDNNKNYNLRNGSTAEIAIPVDPMQTSSSEPLPPKIPFLFYDEVKGIFKEMNEAQLSFNGGIPGYIAKTSHFTTFNADVLKTDQACVSIQSSALGGNFNTLEFAIPLGDAAPRISTRTLDNSSPSEHVIYNLPTDTNIVLVALHDPDLTDPNNENIPLGTYVVNTGQTQNPTTPNKPVGPPYTACSTEVVMNPQTIPPGGNDSFLQGLFSFDAINQTELVATDPSQDINDPTTLAGSVRQATLDYYQQIDPRGKRATLEGAVNSFVSTNSMGGAGDIRAPFANSGDLGFGRDMHCKKTWVDDDGDGIEETDEYDVACHVTNYGDHITADSEDASAAAAQATVNLSNRIATVAMEYSRIESALGNAIEFDDPERVVKFYVYNAAGDALLPDADLDGFGARPIPQLCMVCHGGAFPSGNVTNAAPAFNSRDDVKLGSRFLPFDIFYYTFAGDQTDPANPFSKDNLQDEFEALNKEIVKATIPTTAGVDPIEEVIDSMYPIANTDQVDDFVVPGWNNSGLEEQMYTDVVAKACRACHLASPFDGSTGLNLRFDEAADFDASLGSVEARVCTDFVMPHAKRTYDIFWGSSNPHMPAILQLYGDAQVPANGWSGGICGDFTPGGNTPESFYSTDIQPIWDATCAGAGCHIGGASAGLDLSGSAVGDDPSYGNTVNVASTQEPGLNRFLPNSLANSYIHKKLVGTQTVGSNMPIGGFPIDPAVLTIIENWINSGAPGP